jgi:hypothetical protein
MHVTTTVFCHGADYVAHKLLHRIKSLDKRQPLQGQSLPCDWGHFQYHTPDISLKVIIEDIESIYNSLKPTEPPLHDACPALGCGLTCVKR